MARLALISDTHLGAAPRDVHAANFEAVVRRINASAPDLVLNCGDLSFHGRIRGDDLDAAKAAHERLAPRVRVIAGNHDVGDSGPAPYGGWGITDDRRAAYAQRFGPEWWQDALGDWRIIGVNAQLMGSGLAAEAAQWAWLADTLSDAAQPTLLAIHKPVPASGPADRAAAALDPVSAARLRALLAPPGHGPRVLCSGHVHEGFDRVVEGIHVIGAPSTASRHGTTPRFGGALDLGLIELDLTSDAAAARFVAPDDMTPFDVADQQEAYANLKTQEPWP